MNTKVSSLATKPFICFAAMAACAALFGATQATGHEVTVKIQVSTAGLDLNQPAGARGVCSAAESRRHRVHP
jgi:UrcA family protein